MRNRERLMSLALGVALSVGVFSVFGLAFLHGSLGLSIMVLIHALAPTIVIGGVLGWFLAERIQQWIDK